jgi:hypothetical protein
MRVEAAWMAVKCCENERSTRDIESKKDFGRPGERKRRRSNLSIQISNKRYLILIGGVTVTKVTSSPDFHLETRSFTPGWGSY